MVELDPEAWSMVRWIELALAKPSERTTCLPCPVLVSGRVLCRVSRPDVQRVQAAQDGSSDRGAGFSVVTRVQGATTEPVKEKNPYISSTMKKQQLTF